jgi:hypothetical protein
LETGLWGNASSNFVEGSCRFGNEGNRVNDQSIAENGPGTGLDAMQNKSPAEESRDF